jgi:hypothetical protein
VDSLHNKARKHCEDFRNQRQSVGHAMASGSKKHEEEYLNRITIMETYEFVLIMHFVIKLFGKTIDLSQCLQKKDQNIVCAIGLIGATLQQIDEIKQHGWE